MTTAMSAIEAELSKATKLKPLKDEPRAQFLIRVWNGAYELKDEAWEKLSTQAANWANDVTLAHKKWNKGKPNGEFAPDDFPDVVAEAKPKKAKAKPVEEDEDEEEVVEKPKIKAKAGPKPPPEPEEEAPDEDKDEAPDEEEAPDEVEAAQLKPKNEPEVEQAKAKKPQTFVPKSHSKDVSKDVKDTRDEPILNVQGMVRTMMIDNPNMGVEDMHQKIEEEFDTAISLTTVRASRSWFKAALRDLLREDCLSKAFKAKLAGSGGV